MQINSQHDVLNVRKVVNEVVEGTDALHANDIMGRRKYHYHVDEKLN
jgi:hypothetical protein